MKCRNEGAILTAGIPIPPKEGVFFRGRVRAYATGELSEIREEQEEDFEDARTLRLKSD
jgi:hypothetical protein